MRRFAVALCVVLFALPAQAMVWPNAIERVEAELSSPDLGTRRSAAEELQNLPRSATRRLLGLALNDQDAQVRVAAAEAAIQVRFEPAVRIVRGWLSDRDPRVRQVAAQVLGGFPLDEETLTNLGRALADPQPEVRLAAAQALGASRSPEATLPLLGHLDDSNPQVQLSVVAALERLKDPRSIMPLVGKIQDTRSSVRQAVARALGALGGPRVVPGLVLALRDNDAKVRSAAVRALGRARGDAAVAALASVLAEDQDSAVQIAALFAAAQHNTDTTAGLVIEALDSQRSEVRTAALDALQRFGAPATPSLVQCVQSASSRRRADGCLLGLANGAHQGAYDVVLKAWSQRAVSSGAALQAMEDLADPRALPVALEALMSEDPQVRRQALTLADALLDPQMPDGRAVEPLAAVLEAARERSEERIAIVALLGETGASRAARHIAPLAVPSAPLRLRVAAIRALGQVGAREPVPLLMDGLSDESARVRKEAALALRRCATEEAAAPLLSRLEDAAEQDRQALALALSGALENTRRPRLVARVTTLIAESTGRVQDALLEALSQAAPEVSLPALRKLAAGGGEALRAKVAEVLSAVPGSAAVLTELLSDRDGRVRASAAWSFGVVGGRQDLPLLVSKLSDPQAAVAANLIAAVARIAATVPTAGAAAESLCASLEHPRSYVRANALAGLRLIGARCPSGTERWLLARDKVALVRQRAAVLLRSSDSGGDPEDNRALSTCRSEEPNGAVASACAQTQQSSDTTARGTVTVFAAGATETNPTPRAPYALEFADGLVKLGVSDRRGAVFTAGAPLGPIQLHTP